MAPEGHTLQMASISSKIMICKSLWSPTIHKNIISENVKMELVAFGYNKHITVPDPCCTWQLPQAAIGSHCSPRISQPELQASLIFQLKDPPLTYLWITRKYPCSTDFCDPKMYTHPVLDLDCSRPVCTQNLEANMHLPENFLTMSHG